jgi:hypothetical protein
MKKLIVLTAPLLALAACNGGGDAGNNQANGTEAANAVAGNEAAPAAGNEAKPADGNADAGSASGGEKPAEGAAAAEEAPAEGGGDKPAGNSE